jgi:xanthine dehydrogenase small subunit
MTVLEYLRTRTNLTGTKEGCAEGDCGACTVIVGEICNDEIYYKAVNACIMFVPALDGKHLVTIEYLKSLSAKPHPVQQAMVDCHASQCGFCTPGFVMSLSALFHNNKSVTDDDIQNAIAGNLCRCTGYRPIVDAARSVLDKGDMFLTAGQELQGLRRDSMFAYEADGKKFFSPLDTQGLAEILSEYPDATMLAGGTDVGLWVTKAHRNIDVIIYTGNVSDLLDIEETDKCLEIGAAVSYSKAFDLLAAYDPTMEELLVRFASTQIRNSGTIGGNIANGSPIGDGMPPLIALGTKIILASVKGQREIDLEDYFIAYGKQDINQGEFLEKIIIPAKPDNMLFKTYKLSKRFDQDISAVCGAFSILLDEDRISEARIVFGGMAATPKRAAKAEATLSGASWSEETVRQAMEAIEEDFAPLTDMRASAEYRTKAAQNLLYRFYLETTEPETETRVYRYGSQR